MKTLCPLVDNCLAPVVGVTVGFSKILLLTGMKKVLLKNSNTYFIFFNTPNIK